MYKMAERGVRCSVLGSSSGEINGKFICRADLGFSGFSNSKLGFQDPDGLLQIGVDFNGCFKTSVSAHSPDGRRHNFSNNIRVSLQRIVLDSISSAKSSSIVVCYAKSNEKDPLAVCCGEILVYFVPTVGGVSVAEAPASKEAPGGVPANVVVGIERLSGSFKVGNDEFRYMLSDILKRNNVDNSGVTALSLFVALRADCECEFMYFRNPSADMLLRESELNKDLLRKASVFHYGSVSLIEEPCRSTQLVAMKIPKKAGSILLRSKFEICTVAAKKEIMSIRDQAGIVKIKEAIFP